MQNPNSLKFIITLNVQKSENAEMQETIILLRQQLDSLAERQSQQIVGDESSGHNRNGEESEIYSGAGTPTSVMSLNRVFAQEETKEIKDESTLNSQVFLPFQSLLLCFLKPGH